MIGVATAVDLGARALKGVARNWPLVLCGLAIGYGAYLYVDRADARAQAAAQKAKAEDAAEDLANLREDYERWRTVMAKRDEQLRHIDDGVSTLKAAIAQANRDAQSAYGVCSNVPIDPSIQSEIEALFGSGP